MADRKWSATYVSVAVINSRNSTILAAVGMIVAVPAAALSSRQFVSMSGGLAAGIPATGTVTHAHRLPSAIVDFLFDVTEVTFLTRLEAYRLATTCIVAWYLASSVVMCKVLTDVMNVRRHLQHCHWPRGAARYHRKLQRKSTLATATIFFRSRQRGNYQYIQEQSDRLLHPYCGSWSCLPHDRSFEKRSANGRAEQERSLSLIRNYLN